VTGFASPDVPAYVAYALILVLAVLVARYTVNDRLATHPDRWAFAGTWALFLAHVAIPLLLFWFLDYTSVVHDTSLFAAFLVAFGYQQIFAGGFQGIQLPGQTGALWKPFDAWVVKVVDRMATRSKLYLDRFDYKVRSLIMDDPGRTEAFRSLALARSKDPAKLQAALAGFTSTGDDNADQRLRLDILWRDFRAAEPDLYGWLLYQRRVGGGTGWWPRRVVQGWRYWIWLKNGRSKLISAAVLVGVLAVIVVALVWLSSFQAGSDRQHDLAIQYHQWRFLKANATDRDRWRSREYVTSKFAALAVRPVIPLAEAQAASRDARAEHKKRGDELEQYEKEQKPGERKQVGSGAPGREALQASVHAADKVMADAVEEERRALDAEALLAPFLRELRLPSLSAGRAREILELLFNAHSPNLNHLWVPLLIESLRTQSEGTRLEARKIFVALQLADYASVRLPDDLAKWEPKKDEAAGDIDVRVRRFHEWWEKTRKLK
jgi:hypothetical protein